MTRLVKYVAHTGIGSRRAVEELIRDGFIKVNGLIEVHPFREIRDQDIVTYQGKTLKAEEFSYFVINKPAGCITTTKDEEGRPTIFDIIKIPGVKRLYPIGRLDCTTSGALILTNDGDLAQTLSHPKYGVSKEYKVTLHAPITPDVHHFILQGTRLVDGMIKVDRLEINPRKPYMCLVTIHSGKNRILRRLFVHYGLHVTALERISFAHISTKGLAKAEWRKLTSREVASLKLHEKKKERIS